MSADGTNVLLRAGTLSINSPDPECVDLYAVRTDGSGATRLTPFRGGRSVSGAAFSPDGRHVAYTWWGSEDTMTVLDLASGQEVDQPCGALFGFTPNRIEWSPAGDTVAIACSGIVTILDASGATESVPIQSTREQLLFGWTDNGQLLVSTDGGGILSHDVESQTTTSIGHIDTSGIELVTPSSGGFSPDGRWLAFQGGERGDVPGNDFRIVGYFASTTGGTPIRVLNEDEAGSSITWSTDGRTLIAAHGQTLGRLDPETLQWSQIGPLLDGQGIWQIP
jgi:Tol biopolymer transport system component